MRPSTSLVAALVAGAAVLWPGAATAAPGADCAALTRPPAAETPAPDQLACADLRGLEFDQARLAGADLHGSNLAGVSLLQADLTGADLRGADLTGANLGQADLTGANLTEANLAGAYLGQTELTKADLRGAVLTDADATQVFLADADLRGADLTGAYLGQAELIRADLRGADLDGADLTQAETEGALGLADHTGHEEGRFEPDIAETSSPSTGFADVLLWPAAAIAIAWWRLRVGFLLRHRPTTPPRPVDLVRGIVGIGLVVLGLYLAVVGSVRGFARLVGGAPTDPGPLTWFGSAPHHQLAVAAGAVLLGALVARRPRRRAPDDRPSTGAQVAVGQPSPGAVVLGFGPAVRLAALVGWIAVLVDVVLVVTLAVLGLLPDTGLWRADTVVAHGVFAAIASVALGQVLARGRRGTEVTTPTGLVFVGGGRDPYLWVSGTSADRRPASEALLWDAVERVHLIRVLGTAEPGALLITVRRPGADQPVEYQQELPVTPEQVAALRALLPAETFAEHTRVPSSS